MTQCVESRELIRKRMRLTASITLNGCYRKTQVSIVGQQLASSGRPSLTGQHRKFSRSKWLLRSCRSTRRPTPSPSTNP